MVNPQTLKKRLDLDIPDNDRASIAGAIQVLTTTLLKYLFELSPADVRALPKVGPKSFAFAALVRLVARKFPQFMPPFCKQEDLERDVDAIEYLRDLQQALTLILARVTESLTVVGVQADHSSRAYYGTTQRGTAVGEPHARDVRDQLAVNFEKRRPAPAAASRVEGESAMQDDSLEPPPIEE